MEERLSNLEARISGADFINQAQAHRYQVMANILASILKRRGKGNQATIHAEVKRTFNVPSYQLIPAKEFPRVVDFLANWQRRLTPPGTPFAGRVWPAGPKEFVLMARDTEQHAVVLSGEVWAATQERAVLERTTASEICERLLSHYLSLDEKPPHGELPADIQTKQRSIHARPTTWATAKAQKVLVGRPVSEILEQLLRAYQGFHFPR